MGYTVEHIGISVSHPIEMAEWYKNILGFNVKFSAGNSQQAVAFLSDADGEVILEFGKIPNVASLREQTSQIP